MKLVVVIVLMLFAPSFAMAISGVTITGGVEWNPIAPIPPPSAVCDDDVNCRCDLIQNPPGGTIILCEDFENPNLPGYTLADSEHPSSFESVYGLAASGCTAGDPQAAGKQYWTGFGNTLVASPQNNRCADIVDEALPTMGDGGCWVAGETDCVHDGNKALGKFYRPGINNSIFADSTGFAMADHDLVNFGITYAQKQSDNFFHQTGQPNKGQEYGEGNVGLGGLSNGGGGDNPPWGGFFWGPVPNTFTVIRGITSWTPALNFGADKSDYHYGVLAGDGPGIWECHRVHYSGWGTSSMEMRGWSNNTLAFHITGIDMTQRTTDTNGLKPTVTWNNYHNPGFDPDKPSSGEGGCDLTPGTGTPTSCGYRGTTLAMRYEDNLVIVEGPEPASCADIGFAPGWEIP